MLTVKATITGVSSAVERSGMSEIDGGVLISTTLTVKAWRVMLLLEPSSITVTVIRAMPLELGMGVNMREPVGSGLW